MAKTIYTERDVEDLARRGVREIVLTDEVYVTDVARERAERLGIALRPTSTGQAAPAEAGGVATPADAEQVVSRVKADVIAKLGPGLDSALIERIVRRVVSQLK